MTINGQISLAAVGNDADNELSFVIRPHGHFVADLECGPWGDAHENAFHLSQLSAHLEGFTC
jgi:hypothetical protein